MPIVLKTGRLNTQGVALIVVLWMLALLSVIAGSLVFTTRTELVIAGNVVSMAQAEAAADAGVYKAISELLSPRPNDPLSWKANSLVHPWEFGGARLAVMIADEGGKVNLNSADPQLLKSLFVSRGVDESAAESLVDALADWRDPDTLRRLHGAEKEDYLAAGLRYGPANTNLTAIEELRQVLGMSDSLYLMLAPLVTVFSGQAGINPASAARDVLLALPGASPFVVDQYLSDRQAAAEQGLPPPIFPLAVPYLAGGISPTVTVQATAVMGDNMYFCREAVIRLTSDRLTPYTVAAWRAPTGPVPSMLAAPVTALNQ